MPFSAKQEIALAFLKENIEFFAAPLWNQVLFTQWANHQALLVEFSTVLVSAIDNILHYKNALIGAGNLDRHHSLLYGNDERMRHLLESNKPLVEVLSQLSRDTEVIALWNSWYATHPDIVPKRKALGDNLLAEKVQQLEQKEQARWQKPVNLEKQKDLLAQLSDVESAEASASTPRMEQDEISSPITAAAASSSVPKEPHQGKLAVRGLKKICRRFNQLGTDMEVFFDITLVFDNQQMALEFRNNLWQRLATEPSPSLDVLDFEEFNKFSFPTEFMFQIKAVRNSDLYHDILDHENMAGGFILSELEKWVNTSNVPQVNTDYHCNERIRPTLRTSSPPPQSSEQLTAPGLQKICRRFNRSAKDTEVFSDITLIFENEKLALEFRDNLGKKFEAEQIYSINVSFFEAFDKDLFPSESMLQVVTMFNSTLDRAIAKNQDMAGSLMLTEFKKLVDITNIFQIDTNERCRERGSAQVPASSPPPSPSQMSGTNKSTADSDLSEVPLSLRGLVRSKFIFFSPEQASKIQTDPLEAKVDLSTFNFKGSA